MKADPLKEAASEINPYNIRVNSEFGTNASYLTSRIARDRPDILERMKAGEFTSVRKAALTPPRRTSAGPSLPHHHDQENPTWIA